MQEIGSKIAKKEYDIYLLEELWMRPDHQTIKDSLNGELRKDMSIECHKSVY